MSKLALKQDLGKGSLEVTLIAKMQILYLWSFRAFLEFLTLDGITERLSR